MKLISFLKQSNEQFDSHIDEIMAGNKFMLKITANSALIIFTVLFGLSFFVKSIEASKLLYLVFAVLMLIFVIANRYIKESTSSTRIMIHILASLLIAFSIVLGTYLSVEFTAAVFLILLILLPILFVENIVISTLTTFLYVLSFSICAIYFKDSAVYSIDIINAITSFVITLVTISIISKIKLRDLILQDNLITLSNEDELTKLFNRRYINNYFNEMSEAFQNDEKDFGVVILDIDDFKDYNDTYGHIDGDKCIMQVAKVVKKVSEEYSAISCRFGGEEFLMVLIDQNISFLDVMAEKILQGVRDLKVANNTQYGIVTVSVGSATKKGVNSKNYIELIRKADEALYKAKGTGKNKYVKAISEK